MKTGGESSEISNHNLTVKKEEYILLVENGISDVGILPKKPENNWAAPIFEKGIMKLLDFLSKNIDKIVPLWDKAIKYAKNPARPPIFEAIKQIKFLPPPSNQQYYIAPNVCGTSGCITQYEYEGYNIRIR